jgi:hypothetical protein
MGPVTLGEISALSPRFMQIAKECIGLKEFTWMLRKPTLPFPSQFSPLWAFLLSFVGKNRKENRLIPSTCLAYAHVLAGIVSGDDAVVGHSSLGVGVLLAVVDMASGSRCK